MRGACTRFWYPRLTRHPDARILTQTNALLEQRHWIMNLDALGCKSSIYQTAQLPAGSLGDYDREIVQIACLPATLMSVTESGSTYCGGAHPSNHYDPFTLDLLHGGYLDFSRLLKGYRQDAYTPAYSEAFMALVREKIATQEARDIAVNGEDGESACADVFADYMHLHFESPEQLAFMVSGVGHAAGACLGLGVSVPFAELVPLWKPQARAYLWPHQADMPSE